MSKESLVNAIRTALDKEEITYSFASKLGIFSANFGFEDSFFGDIRVLLIPDPKEGKFLNIYSQYGRKADNCPLKMADFLTRANYGLPVGNFELDQRDGEIRYRVFIYPESGQVPSTDKIVAGVYASIGIYKTYGKGIVAVLSGELTPEEAIDLCENSSNDD